MPMKNKVNNEKTAFVMAEVTQYQRISTESDEETIDLNEPVIEPNKNVKHVPSVTHSNAIKWNCECISRLSVLYLMLMVAFGFAISRMAPLHQNVPSHHMEDHHVYKKAAVAAGQKQCSEVGVNILKEGGTAVDAAIATVLCQGVVEPQFCGIGGGFFMVIYNKTTNSSTVIDARETAPARSTKDMLKDFIKTGTAPLTIAIPGELKGYSHAYQKHGGGVSWKNLFDAAIDKAENGFLVGEQLATNLEESKERILMTKALCDVYCDDSRKDVKKANDKVKNPQLASTLKLLSEEGVKSFYNGSLTQSFVKDINDDGGIVSMKDFANYQVKDLKPLKVNLSSNRILLVPPLPSGGPLLGLILSVIDSYHVNRSVFDARETLYWQRTIESFKHAFGIRTQFGDPQFVPDVDSLVLDVLSAARINTIKQQIVDSKTFQSPSYYGANDTFGNQVTSSTSHVAVLAQNGDAVSMTSTVNSHFGSMVMSQGVLFNNEMEDFATQVDKNQTSPNMIEPHKRPLSSIAPCLVVDSKTNEVIFIMGAAGGKQIPTSIAMSLLRLLYFGAEDFDDAIRKPRLHHQLIPDILYYEKEFNSTIIENLKSMGYEVQVQPPRSHVNGIKNHVSHIHAFSDLRNKGAGADGW